MVNYEKNINDSINVMLDFRRLSPALATAKDTKAPVNPILVQDQAVQKMKNFVVAYNDVIKIDDEFVILLIASNEYLESYNLLGDLLTKEEYSVDNELSNAILTKYYFERIF